MHDILYFFKIGNVVTIGWKEKFVAITFDLMEIQNAKNPPKIEFQDQNFCLFALYSIQESKKFSFQGTRKMVRFKNGERVS